MQGFPTNNQSFPCQKIDQHLLGKLRAPNTYYYCEAVMTPSVCQYRMSATNVTNDTVTVPVDS